MKSILSLLSATSTLFVVALFFSLLFSSSTTTEIVVTAQTTGTTPTPGSNTTSTTFAATTTTTTLGTGTASGAPGPAETTTPSQFTVTTVTVPSLDEQVCDGGGGVVTKTITAIPMQQNCFPNSYWNPRSYTAIGVTNDVTEGDFTLWKRLTLFPEWNVNVVWRKVTFSGTSGAVCEGFYIDNNSTNTQTVNVEISDVNFQVPAGVCDFDILIWSRTPIQLTLTIKNTNLPGRIDIRAPLKVGSNITIVDSTVRKVFSESLYMPFHIVNSVIGDNSMMIASRPPMVPRQAPSQKWNDGATNLPSTFPKYIYTGDPDNYATIGPQRLTLYCESSTMSISSFNPTTMFFQIQGNHSNIIWRGCNTSYTGASSAPYLNIMPWMETTSSVALSDFNLENPKNLALLPWEKPKGFNFFCTNTKFSAHSVVVTPWSDTDAALKDIQLNFTETVFAGNDAHLVAWPMQIKGSGGTVTGHNPGFVSIDLQECYFGSLNNIYIGQWNVRNGVSLNVEDSITNRLLYLPCDFSGGCASGMGSHQISFKNSDLSLFRPCGLTTRKQTVSFKFDTTRSTTSQTLEIMIVNVTSPIEAATLSVEIYNLAATSSNLRLHVSSAFAYSIDVKELYVTIEDSSWGFMSGWTWPPATSTIASLIARGYESRISNLAVINIPNVFPGKAYFEFSRQADVQAGFAISCTATQIENQLVNVQFNMTDITWMGQLTVGCVLVGESIGAPSTFTFKRVNVRESAYISHVDTSPAGTDYQSNPVTFDFQDSSIQINTASASVYALLHDLRKGHYNYLVLSLVRCTIDSALASASSRTATIYEFASTSATSIDFGSSGRTWNSINIVFEEANITGSDHRIAWWNTGPTSPPTLNPRISAVATDFNFGTFTTANTLSIITNFPKGGSLNLIGQASAQSKTSTKTTSVIRLAQLSGSGNIGGAAFLTGAIPDSVTMRSKYIVSINGSGEAAFLGSVLQDDADIIGDKRIVIRGCEFQMNANLARFIRGYTTPRLLHFSTQSKITLNGDLVAHLVGVSKPTTNSFTESSSTIVIENTEVNIIVTSCAVYACGATIATFNEEAQNVASLIINSSSTVFINSSNAGGLWNPWNDNAPSSLATRKQNLEISGSSSVYVTGTAAFATIFYGRSDNDTNTVTISSSTLEVVSTDSQQPGGAGGTPPNIARYQAFVRPNGTAFAMLSAGGTSTFSFTGSSSLKFDLSGANYIQPSSSSFIGVFGTSDGPAATTASLAIQGLSSQNLDVTMNDFRSYDPNLERKPETQTTLFLLSSNVSTASFDISKATLTAKSNFAVAFVVTTNGVGTVTGNVNNNCQIYGEAYLNAYFGLYVETSKVNFNFWSSTIRLKSTITEFPTNWLAHTDSNAPKTSVVLAQVFKLNDKFDQNDQYFQFTVSVINSFLYFDANMGGVMTVALAGDYDGPSCVAASTYSFGKFSFKSSTLEITANGEGTNGFSYHGLAVQHKKTTATSLQCPITYYTEYSTIKINSPSYTTKFAFASFGNGSLASTSSLSSNFISSESMIMSNLAAAGSKIGRAVSNWTTYNFTTNPGSSLPSMNIVDPQWSRIGDIVMKGNYFNGPYETDAAHFGDPVLIPTTYFSTNTPYLACNKFNGTYMELNTVTVNNVLVFYNNSECEAEPTTTTTTATTTTTTTTEEPTTTTTTTTEKPKMTTEEPLTTQSTNDAGANTTTETKISGTTASSSVTTAVMSQTTESPASTSTTTTSPPPPSTTTTSPPPPSTTTTATSTNVTQLTFSSTTVSTFTTTPNATTTTSTTTRPPTPPPQPPAAQQAEKAATVTATVTGAAVSTIVPSPATAVLASRLGMIGKISECNNRLNVSLEFYESPFDVKIKFSDSPAAEDVQYHLGGLITNLGFLFAWGGLSLLVASINYLYKNNITKKHVSWAESQAFGRFPSCLMFPLLFFCQPFFGSAITTMLFGDTAATCVAAMILLLVILILCIMIGHVTTKARFMATFRTKIELDVAEELELDKPEPDWIDKFGDGFDRYILGSQGEWFDIPHKYVKVDEPQKKASMLSVKELKDSAPTYFTIAFGGLFDCYRGGRQWFVAADFAAAIILGMCDGLLASFGCSAAGWLLVGIFAIYVLALFLLRPMCTRFETIMGCITAFLQLTAAFIAVLTAGADPDSEEARAVASVSTAALMVGTVQALFMAITDGTAWLVQYGKGCFSRRAARKAAQKEELRIQREEEENAALSTNPSGAYSAHNGRQFDFGRAFQNEEEMLQVANDRDEAAKIDIQAELAELEKQERSMLRRDVENFHNNNNNNNNQQHRPLLSLSLSERDNDDFTALKRDTTTSTFASGSFGPPAASTNNNHEMEYYYTPYEDKNQALVIESKDAYAGTAGDQNARLLRTFDLFSPKTHQNGNDDGVTLSEQDRVGLDDLKKLGRVQRGMERADGKEMGFGGQDISSTLTRVGAGGEHHHHNNNNNGPSNKKKKDDGDDYNL